MIPYDRMSRQVQKISKAKIITARSIGLIVFLLVAVNHMAGGRASNVLRPVSNIASGLVSFAVRLCMSALGGVVRLLGGSLKPLAHLRFAITKCRLDERRLDGMSSRMPLARKRH
jgi:hypothetical protein